MPKRDFVNKSFEWNTKTHQHRERETDGQLELGLLREEGDLADDEQRGRRDVGVGQVVNEVAAKNETNLRGFELFTVRVAFYQKDR